MPVVPETGKRRARRRASTERRIESRVAAALLAIVGVLLMVGRAPVPFFGEAAGVVVVGVAVIDLIDETPRPRRKPVAGILFAIGAILFFDPPGLSDTVARWLDVAMGLALVAIGGLRAAGKA